MNLPKFPHSAMFVGVTACSKTEFLLKLLETVYKNHFEFIVILCPTILDNKVYLSRKWIFDDKNVFIVCDLEGKLNEWIKLFKNALKDHQTLFIIDDCSAEGEINKKRDALSELAFSSHHRNKTNDLILNLTPENVTQHSRIVTTTCKGSSTSTKMSKIIGRQIH